MPSSKPTIPGINANLVAPTPTHLWRHANRGIKQSDSMPEVIVDHGQRTAKFFRDAENQSVVLRVPSAFKPQLKSRKETRPAASVGIRIDATAAGFSRSPRQIGNEGKYRISDQFCAMVALGEQAEALLTYLSRRGNIYLWHIHSLDAVAATHGHRNWSAVTALCRSPSANQGVGIISFSPVRAHADRLQAHLFQQRGFVLKDPIEAIAAMRRCDLSDSPPNLLKPDSREWLARSAA
jgi:hypothetical protein